MARPALVSGLQHTSSKHRHTHNVAPSVLRLKQLPRMYRIAGRHLRPHRHHAGTRWAVNPDPCLVCVHSRPSLPLETCTHSTAGRFDLSIQLAGNNGLTYSQQRVNKVVDAAYLDGVLALGDLDRF